MKTFTFILKIIIFSFFISCSKEKEENFCASNDLCSIVQYEQYSYGFSITNLDCMGNDKGNSIINTDNYGRVIYVLETFENGSISVNNVKYTDSGLCTSYSVSIKWKSHTYSLSIVNSYNNDNILTDINCTVLSKN